MRSLSNRTDSDFSDSLPFVLGTQNQNGSVPELMQNCEQGLNSFSLKRKENIYILRAYPFSLNIKYTLYQIYLNIINVMFPINSIMNDSQKPK